MPPVPQIIPPVQEPAIASFSAEELASGIGVVNFYAVKGKDPSGNLNALTEFQVGSEPIETQVNDTTTIFTFTSSKFNLPRYVKGTGYATINLYRQGTSVSPLTAAVKLQHWDGSTATDLTGTATSNNHSQSGSDARGTTFLQFPITTEKMIKKGEMIRAVVTIASNSNAYFGHSPDNKISANFNTQGTRLTIGVPFRRGI